ncbi:MAG: FGGY family carbohydrate kinase, partial [Candidatus Magasanikbacteria bacterium]|nr:FGGY family carbohydrate kinase [Candidatus Magasanikbacteria bacterium]
MKYLISLDIGTSSLRAILFNEKLEVVKIVQEEISSFYPFPGWVEQDPNELWQKTSSVLKRIAKDVLDKNEKIEGIN